MLRIPFCPVPVEKAKYISRKFYGIASHIASKNLKWQLKQADMALDEIEYMSIAIFSSLFMFGIMFFLITILGVAVMIPLEKILSISLSLSFVMFFVTMVFLKMYPRLMVKRKIKNIERNLLSGMRHIYIQIKSGVSIFDALVSVANSDYGQFSSEIKTIVKEMNAGKTAEKAMEESATKNASSYFRRSIWHLSNGMRAGADIGPLLRSIIDNLSTEQRVEIRKFGAQMNPLSLVYMLIAVIMPALGITFLMILSVFSGMTISETMFWLILVMLIVLQFMFMGIMKSKRPNLL